MKKFIFSPAIAVLIVILSGCATTDDLRRVRNELDTKLTSVLDAKMAKVDENMAAVEARLAGLKEEDVALRGEAVKNAEALLDLRKNTTENVADTADIRLTIQQLRGQMDALRKDLAAIAVRANRKDEEYKDIRDKLNEATFKVNFIENFLGIGKREDLQESAEKNEKVREAARGKQDKESVYAAAYELFKDGKYERAREMFQNFLKQYPDTEYSDNAQFWLAECYYFEKKYENAILEYEKVSKNYPEGDKVPNALLKQGITFLNLGDKVSARLILQRVIKNYPNTSQARTAMATMLNIK